ncbi:MAG: hypothetical protein QOJ73_5369 [Streptosporangiaceae bacterium]|jgi:hypothetical protein|nr:hypothetical protein [Streptosporangiaceae bacterium]
MNDDEVLGAVRGSLTAVRDSLDGVHMERPVEALVARGRARRVRRTVAIRAAVACGTAAVTAAVLAVTGGASGTPARTGPGGAAQAHPVADVMLRMENALAANNMVMQTETTFSPAFPAVMQWNYRGNIRMTQSGFMPPAGVKGLPWAQGLESWGYGTATINGKLTYVQVDYRRHEWYPTGEGGFMPNQCSIGLNIAESNPVDWPPFIQQALSCGKFRIAGHARVNGKETITITGSQTSPKWWAGVPHAEGRGGLQVDATLYVDPSTDLPVRVLWSNVTHLRDGRPLRGLVSEDIHWLPPTPANVARASVTIPAGFRRVPDGSFGGPLFQFYG